MKARLKELQSQLTAQVKESTLWQTGHHWYQALPVRDRTVVKAVAALFVIAMIYLIVYAPLLKGQQTAEAALKKNIATYNLLADNANRFGAVSGNGNSGGQSSLLATVTRYAKTAGISLSRYEQDGNNLRIWIDKAVFDEAIDWLEQLQASQGVQVGQINIERSDRPGVVDIRATLTQ